MTRINDPRRGAFGRALLLGAALLLCAGCSRQHNSGSYVARVDNATLTQADITALRLSNGDSLARPEEYVNDWIVTELLYQEAERRGLAESDEIKRNLEAARKRLAVAALLDAEVYTDDTSSVNEDAIMTYYNGAGNAFALREDVAQVSYVTFTDRDAANAFRSRVLRGTPWDEAVAAMQEDSIRHGILKQLAMRQYVTQATLYPEELWKLARTLGKEEVSFVVKTSAGFSVLKAHSLKRQGEIADLAYVRGEVRDRILIEVRRLKYEKFLADIRSKHAIEIHTAHADSSAAE